MAVHCWSSSPKWRAWKERERQALKPLSLSSLGLWLAQPDIPSRKHCPRWTVLQCRDRSPIVLCLSYFLMQIYVGFDFEVQKKSLKDTIMGPLNLVSAFKIQPWFVIICRTFVPCFPKVYLLILACSITHLSWEIEVHGGGIWHFIMYFVKGFYIIFLR